ncbi:MAG: TPM domain-containing protein [Calditrichota bacterium]
MVLRTILWILIGSSVMFCQAHKPVSLATYPPAIGYVSDYSGLLEDAASAELNSLLSGYADSASTQIFIAILDSLENDQSLNEAAVRIFEEWKPGTIELNNGVLFLILPRLRVMRLEIGYGLEKVLTDKRCGFILDSLVTPRFSEKDFHGGILAAVQQIKTHLDKEWQPVKQEE